MKKHHGRRSLALAVLLALGACAPGPERMDTTTSPTAGSEPTASPTIQDISELPDFSPLDPGTYRIDPDFDPSTPLRVTYEVPAEGWSMWIGAVKFGDDDGHVAVSITTVANLVRHGCRDHSWADPPVGPSVNDLAAGLADLAPFRVTSPPKDVTIYGYSGKHLELTVPDLNFDRCVNAQLKSWVGAIDTASEGDAFYGYTGPGYSEEIWILDVEGTRLVIAAERSRGSPPEDLAELRAILDSIRIEP
jgi:hypothetical protein